MADRAARRVDAVDCALYGREDSELAPEIVNWPKDEAVEQDRRTIRPPNCELPPH